MTNKEYVSMWGLLAFVLAIIAGCSSLGLPSPDTFSERLASGYAAVTEVRTSATTLLNANKIDVADAKNIQEQADNARSGLDVARSLSKADITSANNRLIAITTTLNALSAYLATQEKKQ